MNILICRRFQPGDPEEKKEHRGQRTLSLKSDRERAGPETLVDIGKDIQVVELITLENLHREEKPRD